MMNNHLHGGKWSQEEELYASVLIDAFKAGELPQDDIEEGTSLRKYLAKKLMCSPKRVSKKYEGTNYNGKQVYFRNRAATTGNDLLVKARLQPLEHNFLRTLSETKLSGGAQGPISLPTSNASSELQMLNHLQLQALNDSSRSLGSGLLSQNQFHSGLPYASLPQSSGLARLNGLPAHSSFMGANLLNSIPAGSNQFSLTSPPGTGSLMPRLSQDQEYVMLAARINAANQSSLPSGSNPSSAVSDALSLSQFNAGRTLLEAAQRQQQLEDAILGRTQRAQQNSNPMMGTFGGGGGMAGLEALVMMRRIAAGQPPTNPEHWGVANTSRPSLLDYLNDTTSRSDGTPSGPSAEDIARAQFMLRHNQHQEQQGFASMPSRQGDGSTNDIVSRLLHGNVATSDIRGTGATAEGRSSDAAKRPRPNEIDDREDSDSTKRRRGN